MVKIICPDCGVVRHHEGGRGIDSIKRDYLTICCNDCHKKRVEANHAKDDIPVGGQSCTDDDESKMRAYVCGCSCSTERMKGQSGARNGRVIRKSTTMS